MLSRYKFFLSLILLQKVYKKNNLILVVNNYQLNRKFFLACIFFKYQVRNMKHYYNDKFISII